MRRTLAYIVAVAFTAAAAAPSLAAEKADPAKALFESKCSACHPSDRPKSKKKDKAEWEQTVQRMKKNGAKLTDDEVKAIVEYLAKTYGK